MEPNYKLEKAKAIAEAVAASAERLKQITAQFKAEAKRKPFQVHNRMHRIGKRNAERRNREILAQILVEGAFTRINLLKIISTPVPKFKNGSPDGGIAMVGEGDKETIKRFPTHKPF